MKEIACQFGDNQRLSGIMTRSTKALGKEALVFIGVGFEPKFGPYRLHTKIARMAADNGLDSFRFDYGDLGYSQPEQSIRPLSMRKNNEIKAALDYVQSSFNIHQFVLIGLCSGAEDGFRYADLDERVKGVIMIDTFAYQTILSPMSHFFSRVKGWSLRQFNTIFRPYSLYEENGSTTKTKGLIDYQYMQEGESKKILQNLIQRNLKLHFIYTSASSFNHKAQLKKMFPELKYYPGVVLDYLPTIGHTQMLEDERALLLKVIEKQLVGFFLTRTQ